MEYRNKSIDEFFIKAKNLTTSRTIELWDGRTNEGGERSLLLHTTYQLPKAGRGEDKFSKLIATFDQIQNQNLKEIGIDRKGYGYVLYSYFETTPLIISGQSSSIKERLAFFIRCVQNIAEFHELGFPVGDISLETFRIVSGLDPFFFGFFDFQESSAKGTLSMSVVKDNFKYLAPEIKMGGPISSCSDVYSLGVVAYIILCGREEIHDSTTVSGNFIRSHRSPTAIDPAVPEWVDMVLGHALSLDPAVRTKDAKILLSQVENGLRDNKIDLAPVKWSADELIVQKAKDITKKDKPVSSDVSHNPKSGNNIKNKKGAGEQNRTKSPFSAPKKAGRFLVGIIWLLTITGSLAIIMGLLVTFRVIHFGEQKLPPQLLPVESIIYEYNLNTAAFTFLSSAEPKEVRVLAFESMLGKNIILDQVLTSYIGQFYSPVPKEYSDVLSKNIVFWLTHFKYERTKAEIERVLKEGSLLEKPFNYCEMIGLILNVIDSGAVDSARIASLRKIYEKSESFGFKLAAFLGEESSSSVFYGVLREFLNARGYTDLPADASIHCLYILAPETRPLLGENLNEILKKTKIEDLKIIATALLSNSIGVDKEFFSAALSRYMEALSIGRFAKVFVEIGQREAVFGNTKEVAALFKLALTSATEKDINTFLEWNSLDWEQVMYAVLVTNSQPTVVERAFDVLSRRGPNSPIGKSLLAWMKEYRWSTRSSYGYAFGIFCLKDIATPEELDDAFNRIMPVSNSSLFTAFLASGDPALTLQAIERIGPIVQVSDIFPLLSSPFPETRKAGVRALAGRNDIAILQKIVTYYNKEKDPEVKKIYNELHWVTKDREFPGNAPGIPE